MRVIPYIALALLSLTLLAGCEEGPAESAGEEIDQAIENGQEMLEDAVEVEEGPAEDAGEEIDEAIEDGQESLEEAAEETEEALEE